MGVILYQRFNVICVFKETFSFCSLHTIWRCNKVVMVARKSLTNRFWIYLQLITSVQLTFFEKTAFLTCRTCLLSRQAACFTCLITRFVTIVTRRVSHVKQELPTLPEHLSSPRFAAQSSVLCVVFCRLLFICLYFSFGHYIVCASSIYDFWIPLWYLLIFFDSWSCIATQII